MRGEDPAVVSWRLALVPRQARPTPTGRHWWREYVTDAHRSAVHAWERAAEAASNGWATELADWTVEHPHPRFKDALIHLAQRTHP